MKDFFISYTKSDEDYATWVAELIESEGYHVVIQAWDFLPGENFVSRIHESLQECDKLLVILSKGYLSSKWCEAEWSAKLADCVDSKQRKIIPIRIEEFEVVGLLKPLIYIDAVGKSRSVVENEIIAAIEGKIPRVSKGYPSKFNIELNMIENSYVVYDDKIVYTKTCKGVALIDGMRKVHNRVSWFQDETIDIKSLTISTNIEMLDIPDTDYNYNVAFDHSFNKGDKVEYCVQANMSNEKGHFKNFFSTEVIVPIDELRIGLEFRTQSIPNKVYTQKIYESMMNNRTEVPQEHEYRDQFNWDIKGPELDYEYKVYWK